MGLRARGVINFAKGHPNSTCLPHKEIQCAVQASSVRLQPDNNKAPSFPLSYGAAKGQPRLLSALSSLITRQGGPQEAHCPAREDGLFITNGVSHGLDLVAQSFCKPGDFVLVEAATYFLACGVFESHHLRVATVPIDRRGIDVDALETGLAAGSIPIPRLLYTIPTNNNPTGSTLPAERRAKLVALARAYGFKVVADEVYHMLDWHPAQKRPPRMVCFDQAYDASPGNVAEDRDRTYDADYQQQQQRQQQLEVHPDEGVVISLGSFTKILAPGLRVGWVEASPDLLHPLASSGYIVSGGGVAPFASEVVAEALLVGDQDAFLDHIRTEYSRRAEMLRRILAGAGVGLEVQATTGGYFSWVKLPAGLSAAKALALGTEEYGVSFLPGDRCDAGGSGLFDNHIRLCFAYLDDDHLHAGAERIVALVRDAQAKSHL